MHDQLERAYRWLGSLDRSALGRFAVPEDTLALCYALFIVDEDYKNDILTSAEMLAYEREFTNSLNDVTNSNIRFSEYSDEYINAEAEMYYFISRSNLADFEVSERVDFITIAAYVDEVVHDYMAVGITKMSFIEDCIRDGIDAEMALRLVVT